MKGAIAAAACLALLAPATALAKPTGADRTNAARECRAERGSTAATREAFRVRYGTNRNGKNAFGKCVSARARAEAKQRDSAATNAAKECKAERTLDPAAFSQKYGTGKKGANAFGKCVSAKAKQLEADADAADAAKIKARKSAAKECAAERALDPAAFAKKYGTNANGRNAFGKCVSAKAKAKAKVNARS